MKTTFLYTLSDPRTGEIRYLGKSDNPFARFVVHKCDLRKRTHKTNWIQSLQAAGLQPDMELLDEVPDSQWQFWEREYIRVFRAIGIRLTNQTDGGESGNMKGKPQSEFQKCRAREVHTGRIRSEETRLLQSISAKARWKKSGPMSDEVKLKLSLAKRGKPSPRRGVILSEETKQRISVSKKAAFAAKGL